MRNEELIDALYMTVPFLEDATTDPHYKQGAAAKVLKYVLDVLKTTDAQESSKDPRSQETRQS